MKLLQNCCYLYDSMCYACNINQMLSMIITVKFWWKLLKEGVVDSGQKVLIMTNISKISNDSTWIRMRYHKSQQSNISRLNWNF